MPIGTKGKSVKVKTGTKSTSKTPRISPEDLGLDPAGLEILHGDIEDAKKSTDAVKSSAEKEELLLAARKRIFGSGERGAFRVELDDGKTLLVKPSTRSYPLDFTQANRIEEIIESAGFDAGDYYHQSHAITIDANTIYERLGEDEYMHFQAQLGKLMSDFETSDGDTVNLGDCWEMVEKIIARPDFAEKRFALGKKVNLKIEEVKPSTISVEAKREL